MKSLFLFLLALSCSFIALSQKTTTSPEDFSALAGDDWKGKLTYLDYTSEKRSTIDVNLAVTKKKDRVFTLFYSYPFEPNANSKGKITIGKDYQTINKKPIISRTKKQDGTIEIVCTGKGKDNGKKASFKYIYTINANRLTITKEVKYEDGDSYFFRNGYVFTR